MHFDRNGFGYTLNRETGQLLVAEKFDPKVNWANKIDKKPLRTERWETTDPVWWRPPREDAYRLLTDADVDALRAEFAANRREHVLTG